MESLKIFLNFAYIFNSKEVFQLDTTRTTRNGWFSCFKLLFSIIDKLFTIN